MERRVIGFCALMGGTVGSFVPELWGGSGFSLGSMVLGLAGGIAGVFVGARLSGF
jgi:hypothetical protein